MRGERVWALLTASKLKRDLLGRCLFWRASCSALRALSLASSFSRFARFFAASLSLGDRPAGESRASALSERACDRRSLGRAYLYRPEMEAKDGSFLNWVFHDARMEWSFFLTLVSAMGSEARCLMASTSWSSMQATMDREG